MTTEQSKTISASWFVFILAAANTCLYHYPLATYAVDNLDYASINGMRTLLTLFVIVFVVTAVLFFAISLLSSTVLKIIAAIAALCSSIAFYFISTYHVILDKSMMGNILNTQSSESLEFLHPKMLVFVLLLGIVPAWLILRTRVQKVRRLRSLLLMGATLGIGLIIIYLNASTSLWFDKHSKKLGGMILPWSYTINSIRVQLERSKEYVEVTLLPAATSNTSDKTVVVFIIGETARAKNFSLYGYERNTNPLIAASDATALPNVTACSTYTTASIHCMLSHTGATKGSFEPLPSYLQRNNVEVVWRTNNWGEPPLVVEEYTKGSELRPSCTENNCDYEEVLLTGLVERIQASKRDKVLVVLHTKGSHGPSYHTRYPEEFAVFKPVCKSVELDKCTQDELTNAYDNTIIYTDYFLDQTIKKLEQLADRPTAMIYVSDHGESLGEYGLYLHGTPNAIAPAVQLEIPFIVWMSEGFKQLHDIDSSVFTQPEYSHSNVFHSVMGALGVNASVYDETLNIFNKQ